MVNVGVIGATGYVGIEIVRMLSKHPYVNLTSVVSQNFVGKNISSVYPSLNKVVDMVCTDLDIDKICENADILITALPHGVSKEVIPELLKRNKRVIDHSGDFRYKSVEVYEKWYNIKHEMPHLLKDAVYGLSEFYRDQIKSAKLVANPGCYPTCSLIAIAPLLRNNLVKLDNIIIDAASGVSGAGRSTHPSHQFCESNENFRPYRVANHKHTSEIEQELSKLAGKEIVVSFTPHLLPLKRGMICTSYANLIENVSQEELIETYKACYKDEYFVRILENRLPETKFVAGSNFIDIAIVKDERLNRVVVLSALDNLGKGAAGQAVQDLNIMCGFEETTGLDNPGLYL